MEQLTIHLSILLFWPLALALLGASIGRRIAPAIALVGALIPLGYAIVLLIDFDTGRAGLQYVTNDAWIEAPNTASASGQKSRIERWIVSCSTAQLPASRK